MSGKTENVPQVRWTNEKLVKALTFHRDNNAGLMKNSSMGTCGAFDTREATREKIMKHFSEVLGQAFFTSLF